MLREYPVHEQDTDFEDLPHGPAGPWLRTHSSKPGTPSAESATVNDIASRLEHFQKILDRAVDIGLLNVKLLEQIQEGDDNGIGAIHSLNQGHAVLDYPLIYSSRFVDEEVVVSIEEFGVYGVGATESEAVQEIKSELWDLFQDLQQMPSEEMGSRLATTLRVLRARIKQNALDA